MNLRVFVSLLATLTTAAPAGAQERRVPQCYFRAIHEPAPAGAGRFLFAHMEALYEDELVDRLSFSNTTLAISTFVDCTAGRTFIINRLANLEASAEDEALAAHLRGLQDGIQVITAEEFRYLTAIPIAVPPPSN